MPGASRPTASPTSSVSPRPALSRRTPGSTSSRALSPGSSPRHFLSSPMAHPGSSLPSSRSFQSTSRKMRHSPTPQCSRQGLQGRPGRPPGPVGARRSRSCRLPGRGLRIAQRASALPERTLEEMPTHQPDRAHLRRDTPQDQGDRPAPRGEDLCSPRLRGARSAAPRLARGDGDTACAPAPARSPTRAPRRTTRSRFRRSRHGSGIGSRRNLRLELFTPRVRRHRGGNRRVFPSWPVRPILSGAPQGERDR